jgi:hypothetical protein
MRYIVKVIATIVKFNLGIVKARNSAAEVRHKIANPGNQVCKLVKQRHFFVTNPMSTTAVIKT